MRPSRRLAISAKARWRDANRQQVLADAQLIVGCLMQHERGTRKVITPQLDTNRTVPSVFARNCIVFTLGWSLAGVLLGLPLDLLLRRLRLG